MRLNEGFVAMKFKSIFLILFLSSITVQAQDQSTFYVSPGIGITWDFQNTFVFNYKVSLGHMVDEQLFYNVTVGNRINMNPKSQSNKNLYSYYEIQVGYFGSLYPMSIGTGIGMANYSNSTDGKHLRITIFGGAGLFGLVSIVPERKEYDFGPLIIFPIAFDESYRDGSIQ